LKGHKQQQLNEVELGLGNLLQQCQAYLVVLPKDNRQALAIVDQFKTQISSLLSELKSYQQQQEQEGSCGENPLTARELEVLNLILQGHPNKEIAYQLSISDKTVQFHIKSLFSKLQAGSRTEVVTKALKMGLIKL